MSKLYLSLCVLYQNVDLERKTVSAEHLQFIDSNKTDLDVLHHVLPGGELHVAPPAVEATEGLLVLSPQTPG